MAQCCDIGNESLRKISVEASNEIKNKILALPKQVEAVSSKYQVESLLTAQGLYIPRVEVVLGTMEDRKRAKGSAEFANVLTEETMQYIPLGPLLHVLLSIYHLTHLQKPRPIIMS
jgi:hypothetical protein